MDYSFLNSAHAITGSAPDTLKSGLRRVAAAASAPWGSIAAREDPNNGESILSREHPGVFGQFGSSNPQFQASSQAYDAAQAKPPVQSLQRNSAQQPPSDYGQQAAAYQMYQAQQQGEYPGTPQPRNSPRMVSNGLAQYASQDNPMDPSTNYLANGGTGE